MEVNKYGVIVEKIKSPGQYYTEELKKIVECNSNFTLISKRKCDVNLLCLKCNRKRHMYLNSLVKEIHKTKCLCELSEIKQNDEITDHYYKKSYPNTKIPNFHQKHEYDYFAIKWIINNNGNFLYIEHDYENVVTYKCLDCNNINRILFENFLFVPKCRHCYPNLKTGLEDADKLLYVEYKIKPKEHECIFCGVSDDTCKLFIHLNDYKICLLCKRRLSNMNYHTINSQYKFMRNNLELINIIRKAKRCRQCDLSFYDSHSLSEFCPNCYPKECINLDAWNNFISKLITLGVDINHYRKLSEFEINIEDLLYSDNEKDNDIMYYLVLSKVCLYISERKILSFEKIKDTILYVNQITKQNFSVDLIFSILIKERYLIECDNNYVVDNYFQICNFDTKLKGSQLEQVAEIYFKKCNLVYKKEFIDHNCVFNKNKCRFDFYVEYENKKYLIELHGAQHFTFNDTYCTTIQQIKDNQLIDAYKKHWAIENGFEYIMIPFYYSVTQELKKHFVI